MNVQEQIETLRRFLEYVATGRLLPDGRWQSDHFGVILDLPEAATETLRETAVMAGR